jgi:hypothetical protein
MEDRSSFTLLSAEEEQAMRNLLTLSGKEAWPSSSFSNPVL